MKKSCSEGFRYPSTRYAGSKRRLLDWIWENLKGLRFSSALDVFGGTASVSLMMKRHGKKIHYNDLLVCNQTIATAIIENSSTTVREADIESVLALPRRRYPSFIQREFKGIFYLDSENAWLDQTISNILRIENKYKRAILMAALFQACLAKRPFNLFHRANLYIRTANVNRTFYNKTTWERPFPELLKRYVAEYNNAIFSNGKRNKVIGGWDALFSPNGVDLVYIDPPYISSATSSGTDYLAFYHFLEGLSDYQNWPRRINKNTAIKCIHGSQDFNRFTKKAEATTSFYKLLERFQDNILVISYLDDGVPSKQQILEELRRLGKKVKVFEKPHKYALSPESRKELLFIAK
jgi:adenine-specific DNA-methyltransferase